ncbi:MAG: 4-(cytidine 5'-diphospho)-2-C-methyl-D-erythritol kinase [Candidatus Omnitrophota bacterium]
MDKLILKSPAKINLFLEVFKKRKDGFHQIHTLFQAVNFYDSIHIKKSKKNGTFIKTDCRQLPTDNKNIVYRAVEALRQKRDFGGAQITIKKKIPLAAGLGGGSSNAAVVLAGINKLYNLKLSDEELCKIAIKLGSDTAFFSGGYKSAFGRGRGEILEPVELPRYWFLLIFPDFGVSSKEAYEGLELGLTKKNKDAKMLFRALKTKDITQIEKELYNKLEETVFEKFPIMKKTKEIIKTAGYKAVLMSGSGSTFFVLTSTRKEAVAAKERLRFLGWRMQIAGSL